MSEGGRYNDLFDKLTDIEAGQVRLCARTLLRWPLLRADGRSADLLPVMFRHRESLRRLFATYLGYRVTVERRFARLYKSYSATTGRGVPDFTPRTYAYLALTLAVLVEAGRQLLLSQLVKEVRGAAAEAGIAVGDDAVDLRALSAALRHLVTLGVIEETEGTVSTLHQRSATEALITVDSDVLGLVVPRTKRHGVQWSAVMSSGVEYAPEVIARRCLVEDPVVLYTDLPDTAAKHLREHYTREAYWLERYFGLQLEARAEGMLAIDPEEYLTDLPFPGNSTVGRMALLVLGPLMAGSTAADDGCYEVTRDQVGGMCADLVARYPSGWAKGEITNPTVLASRVVDYLLDTGAARVRDGDCLLLLPAAHRWEPQIDEGKSAVEVVQGDDIELPLFEEEDELEL